MKYRIVITLLFVLALAAAFMLSGGPTPSQPSSSPDQGIKLN